MRTLNSVHRELPRAPSGFLSPYTGTRCPLASRTPPMSMSEAFDLPMRERYVSMSFAGRLRSPATASRGMSPISICRSIPGAVSGMEVATSSGCGAPVSIMVPVCPGSLPRGGGHAGAGSVFGSRCRACRAARRPVPAEVTHRPCKSMVPDALKAARK